MTRVLVTGAAGFIGSHLIEALVRRGDEVVGIDNFDGFYPRSMKERNLQEAGRGFAFHEQDMLDVDGLRARLTPETVIVHLAAKAGVRPSLADPAGYAETSVTGTAAVLEAARRAGVSRIAFGSSSSVYGDSTPAPFREDAAAIEPVSPYAATKRAGELLCHTYAHLYGLGVVALRFFTVYGPRQRPDLAIHKFTRMLSQGRAIPFFGDGSTRRDYTWVDDIVQGIEGAIAYAAAHPGCCELVNLGESDTVTLARLVELLGDALGVQPRLERLPAQPGDVERTCADISRARALLGYAPATGIEEGIPRFVDWYRREHG
jgi:UDP-glucuronate 4-epimerase